MNLKELKEILQLMADHSLNEIEIEKDGTKIRLKKAGSGRYAVDAGEAMPVMVPMPQASISAGPSIAVAEAPKAVDAANISQVKSPMVGTFYTAPSPDQPAYAPVGKKVKAGDVLCIVEAMKLMNEIKSEVNGTVTEILVKNGQPVEFDQPLFKIQKD